MTINHCYVEDITWLCKDINLILKQGKGSSASGNPGGRERGKKPAHLSGLCFFFLEQPNLCKLVF